MGNKLAEDFHIKKGNDGETFVKELLEKVLERMDYDFKFLRNSYLPFESVYGVNGFITAEFDFIIFTPFFVFLIEVKNDCYFRCEYREQLWELMNHDMTSNPVLQNRNHKNVFCSELDFPREKVITIEILLENSEYSAPNRFPNDYVFGLENLEENLFYLLSSEDDVRLDFKRLFEDFSNIIAQHKITRDKHIEYLHRTEKVETRIRNVFGLIPLHRTDIVKCDCCQSGFLVLREMPYKSNYDSKRNSMHYAFGCSNFGNKSIGCTRGLIYMDKKKDKTPFLSLEPIHIEERNNWGDEYMNQTVLDKINFLEKQNNELHEQVQALSFEINKANNIIKKKHAKCIELQNDIENVTKDVDKAQNELNHFKHIFGKIYIYN